MAVLIIIILYMALGMLGGNDNNYTPTNNSTAKTMTKPMPVKTITKKLEAEVVAKPKIEKPQVVKNELSSKQKAYLKSISQLQMLQLQQQIAQTKQQIAEAELKTAETSNHLDSFAPAVPTDKHGKPLPPVTFANNYVLQYVANTGGKWQAIISFNGQLINSTVGTILPDGSKVTKITGNHVILSNNGLTKEVGIQPAY